MVNHKIVVIPLTELDQRFEALEKGIDARFKSLETRKEKKPPKDKFITRKEAAKKLRVSLPTLGGHVKKGLIQAHKFGSRVLFKESDIIHALKVIKTSI